MTKIWVNEDLMAALRARNLWQSQKVRQCFFMWLCPWLLGKLGLACFPSLFFSSPLYGSGLQVLSLYWETVRLTYRQYDDLQVQWPSALQGRVLTGSLSSCPQVRCIVVWELTRVGQANVFILSRDARMTEHRQRVYFLCASFTRCFKGIGSLSLENILHVYYCCSKFFG